MAISFSPLTRSAGGGELPPMYDCCVYVWQSWHSQKEKSLTFRHSGGTFASPLQSESCTDCIRRGATPSAFCSRACTSHFCSRVQSYGNGPYQVATLLPHCAEKRPRPTNFRGPGVRRSGRDRPTFRIPGDRPTNLRKSCADHEATRRQN